MLIPYQVIFVSFTLTFLNLCEKLKLFYTEEWLYLINILEVIRDREDTNQPCNNEVAGSKDEDEESTLSIANSSILSVQVVITFFCNIIIEDNIVK